MGCVKSEWGRAVGPFSSSICFSITKDEDEEEDE